MTHFFFLLISLPLFIFLALFYLLVNKKYETENIHSYHCKSLYIDPFLKGSTLNILLKEESSYRFLYC